LIIDFHTHVFDLRGPGDKEKRPVTWNDLIERLDEEGIERAVVLPLGISPEILLGPSLFGRGSDILSQINPPEWASKRVVLFGSLDPRMGCVGNLTDEGASEILEDRLPYFDFSEILEEYRRRGIRGIGELTANLPQDDPLVINMFEQCGNYNFPVLFHTTGPGRGVYGLWDEPGLPRLERLLKAVPGTTCIAHATGIWAEIDGDIVPEDKYTYPKRKIKKRGRLLELLEKYSNLYVDISGTSGFNGITRDRDFGVAFLNEFREKIVFGTDVCFAGKEDRRPHLGYLRKLLEEGEIDQRTFSLITGKNAVSILSLEV